MAHEASKEAANLRINLSAATHNSSETLFLVHFSVGLSLCLFA
jgi:hypothetical protein